MASEENDWEGIADEVIQPKRRERGRVGVKEAARSGQKLKKKYAAGYNTTKLQKLMAARGESNAKNIVLQRGKTLITKKRGDEKRAQVATQKTFDGISIVDNFIAYDKNMVVEPVNRSMSAQFGNYQEQQVREQNGGGHVITTHRPCPI